MTRDFDAAAHVNHMAPIAGIEIKPEWKDAVVANMAMAASMAALVLDFPLDDHVEPAPVFEAGR